MTQMTSPCTFVCSPGRITTTGFVPQELRAEVEISQHVPKWAQRLGVVASPLQVAVRQPLRIETKRTFREVFEIEVDVLEGDWVELPRG